MRDKAEKRRNDYLKAKRKERIYDSKNKDNEDNEIRGFFGKLRKGKIPDIHGDEDFIKDPDYQKISNKRRQDKINAQLEDYYKELLEDLYDED